MRKKIIRKLFTGITAGALCTGLHAVTVLDFEGLNDLEPVTGYYAGGSGLLGSGPGPNFGTTFSTDWLAVIDQDAGGTGNFGGEPSPNTALFLATDLGSVLNSADGFGSGLSFFYSSRSATGSISIYDGLNGTGSLLASLDLPGTPDGGAPDPTGDFSPFVPIGVMFDGLAMSVDFNTPERQFLFDDITLGSATAGGGGAQSVPDSGATFALLGISLATMMGVRSRFRPEGARK